VVRRVTMHRRLLAGGLSGVVALAVSFELASGACDAVESSPYRRTKTWTIPNANAYFYATERMAIDADGAPNAYHPQDRGVDALANSGFPDRDWKSVLVIDPADPSKPFVQRDGEFAGFFIAKTTLQDTRLPATDVRRYVDSRQVPYLVFPGAFFQRRGTGQFGDLGMALSLETGKESAFIIADAGPRDADLGEVSIRLAENLGGSNVNPRNGSGMPRGRFAYVVFPGSKSNPPWPVSATDLHVRAQALLSAAGGWARVRDCASAR
jgi:hypothetical protein